MSFYRTRNFRKKVIDTTLTLNDNLRLVFHATHYTRSGYKQLNYEILRVNSKNTLESNYKASKHIMKGNFKTPTSFLNQTLYRSKSPKFSNEIASRFKNTMPRNSSIMIYRY